MIPAVVSNPHVSGRTVHTCVIQLLARDQDPGSLASLLGALDRALYARAWAGRRGVLLVSEARRLVSERLTAACATPRGHLAVISGGVAA